MIHDSEKYIAYFMRLERLVNEIEQEHAPGEEAVFWLPPISLVEKHPEPKENFSVPQSAVPALQYCDEDGEDEEGCEEPLEESEELPPADNVIAYGGFHDLAEYAAEFRASGVAANGAFSLAKRHVNILEYKRDPEMRAIYTAIQLIKALRKETQTVVMDPER